MVVDLVIPVDEHACQNGEPGDQFRRRTAGEQPAGGGLVAGAEGAEVRGRGGQRLGPVPGVLIGEPEWPDLVGSDASEIPAPGLGLGSARACKGSRVSRVVGSHPRMCVAGGGDPVSVGEDPAGDAA
jgi:hypothetical protein